MSPNRSSAASGSDLRQEIGRKLLSWSSEEKQTASEALSALLDQWLCELRPKLLAAFWPMKSEPDISPALLRFRQRGGELLLPRTVGDGMEFVPIGTPENLLRSPLGFFQPAPSLTSSEEIPDTVLVPGVVFGVRGERIGRGGGFYDRFFSRKGEEWSGVPKVGICFDQQVLPSPVPQHPGDVRVDSLLTETGALLCR